MQRIAPLDLHDVAELRLLPLVDAEAEVGLRTEHGVSYLVNADGRMILFDLGLSAGRRSALMRNARKLGVDLGAIDMVVMSHHHPDHCGGLAAWLRRSFRLPAQLSGGIRVYTPVPVHHRTARCEHSSGPMKLAPGIATTGPIPRQLFLLGWTPELALMVNVRDAGIVVIVGCGHQGLSRLISRVRALTEVPIYAVVGGLHLPVHGLYAQDVLGSARWPWRRTTEHDVKEAISALRASRPRLVALSPHDSSTWTLQQFRAAFADDYRSIRVGDEIVISVASPAEA